MIFGRTGSPARAVLSVVLVLVLATLGITVFRLNTRLAAQEQANEQTLAVSQAIVDINNRVTARLHQLDVLTHTANDALNETKGLGPLLAQLHDATQPAADAVATGRAGGETSQAKLTQIETTLDNVKQRTLVLVKSAQIFGAQGEQLQAVVEGLVADIDGSVAAAKRINNSLPLPG